MLTTSPPASSDPYLQLLFALVVLDQQRQLDAAREVPRGAVPGGEVEAGVAAVLEAHHAAVLQEAAHDAHNANVLAAGGSKQYG